MSYVIKVEGVSIDMRRVNDAMWAAANMRYSQPPTLEEAGEAAMRAVAAYHGVPYEDLLEAWKSIYP